MEFWIAYFVLQTMLDFYLYASKASKRPIASNNNGACISFKATTR